jgi:F-type H+-transporting ATPase subunit delta
VRSLAEHYADALVDVALEQNAAPQIRQELGDFLALLGESPDLHVLLVSPAVSKKNKQSVVQALVNRMGASQTMRNFLFVVLDHRRVPLLPDIQIAFDIQLDERQGVTRADVTTARNLSDVEKQELADALHRLTGRRVEATYRQDAGLIAGAVVRMGSTIYNGSVKAQLERLRTRLAAE